MPVLFWPMVHVTEVVAQGVLVLATTAPGMFTTWGYSATGTLSVDGLGSPTLPDAYR